MQFRDAPNGSAEAEKVHVGAAMFFHFVGQVGK